MGTTFSILRKPDDVTGREPGSLGAATGKQTDCGWVIWFMGLPLSLYTTAGHGVHGFTLDPAIGAYVLVKKHDYARAGKILFGK